MSYTPLLRRIREDKTNYRKRKAILIGRYNFTVVRVSNQNVQIQVLTPSKKGDEVLVSVHSRELIKHGWKGSRKSIPACYLTGLLAGTTAIANNVNRQHALDVIVIITRGQLRFSLIFDENGDKTKMEELLKYMKEEILELIRYCINRETSEKTASDFKLADLSDESFDNLLEKM